MESESIGNKIKEARKLHGLTQKQLSDLSGTSYSTLTKIENGFINDPAFSQIARIGEVFKRLEDQLKYPMKSVSVGFPKITIAPIEIPSFSNYSKILDSVTSATEKILQQFIKQQEKSFNYTNQFANEIQNSFKDLIKTFDLSSLEGLGDYWEEYEKEKKRHQRIIKESGWFFSPTMLDIDMHTLRKVMNQYESGDKKAIYKFAKRMYSRNNFRMLKQAQANWFTNKYFKGREELITEALDNHMRKKYASSIVLLLTQIEGIAGAYCTLNPHLRIKANSGDGKGKLTKAVGDLESQHQLVYCESLLDIVDTVLFANRGISSTDLNRHPILHGNSIEFNNEENSYRCILILDILSLFK